MRAEHSSCLLCDKNCEKFTRLQKHVNDKHNISCFFCIRVLKKKLTKHSPTRSDKSVLEPMTT